MSYEKAIKRAKELVANEEEPFRSIAFQLILSRMLESVSLESKPIETADLSSHTATKALRPFKSKLQTHIPVEESANQQAIEFEIPKSIERAVLDLPERKRIPLLWRFSTKESMTIREFLDAASGKKIPLSHTWLPSEGSNFVKRIVKEDKMLEEDGKVGREKKFKIGGVGNLKINKVVAELEAQQKNP